ncbi:MAG: glutamyl-tRNA reductase [Hahellaceae bacterium]|nr:glutamyl-tRNA reductase [Hahellaceae bacterium]
MSLVALGINHATASVSVRERLSFSPDQLDEALGQAVCLAGVAEVAILSTCNRTEVYACGEDLSDETLIHWLCQYHGVSIAEVVSNLYSRRDEAAAQHMMSVASGLDSLVLGEPQILGQLKDAHARAREQGTVGGTLDRLFQHTFSVAKRVRTETAIGENPVSVAYAAVSMASHIFSDLGEACALLVGAGETIELVIKHLYRSGVRSFIIANRTLSRARMLADEFKGAAIGLEDIPDYLPKADIVIASTASPLPILGKGMVEKALKKRRYQPMFMVDLAVPRDIEAEVARLADVYLYTVDDLKSVVDESLKSREGAATEARHLIAAGAADFMYQLRAQESVSVLRLFREQAEKQREVELAKALKLIRRGDDAEKVVRLLAHGLTNKLIHQPTVQVRRASAEGRIEVSDWLRDLFQLQDGAEPSDNDIEH